MTQKTLLKNFLPIINTMVYERENTSTKSHSTVLTQACGFQQPCQRSVIFGVIIR